MSYLYELIIPNDHVIIANIVNEILIKRQSTNISNKNIIRSWIYNEYIIMLELVIKDKAPIMKFLLIII